MKPVDNQTLLKQLHWRYATKKFDGTKKLSSEDWKTLEQALILSPSSYGLQPWHFFVVTSPAMKQQMQAAAYGQSQVVDASHVVVFALRKNIGPDYVQKFIHHVSEVRGVPAERLEGYKSIINSTISHQGESETDIWSSRQVYIALGNLLTSAAMLGIDVCPMEGIDHSRFDEILELEKQGLKTLVIATIGYRATDDHAANYAKVRFSARQVVTHIE